MYKERKKKIFPETWLLSQNLVPLRAAVKVLTLDSILLACYPREQLTAILQHSPSMLLFLHVSIPKKKKSAFPFKTCTQILEG